MKNKISWIYILIYFFLITIGGSNGFTTDAPPPETQLVIDPVENDRKLLKNTDTDDFSNEIQPIRGLLEVAEPESRILRKKKSKKNKSNKKKAKKLRKNKKSKKSKSKKRKNKKRNKKAKKIDEKLNNEELLGTETEDLLDENENPFSQFPELDDDLDVDAYKNTDLEEENPFSQFPELDDNSDLDSIDEDKSFGPLDPTEKGEVDLYHRGEKYWDSGMVEPEYIISEWFAILDGKKFNRKSGSKSPYVTEDESKFGVDYLLHKKNNSKYLTNKYSSGWKYGNVDNDNMDYITPIVISNESLRRTYPDTKEDEVENRIIGKKYSDTRKQYTGDRELKSYSSGRSNKSTTGSYDLVKDYKENPSEVRGTYRKLDDSEIENYGTKKLFEEPVPIRIDEPESIDDEINELNDPEVLDNEENEKKELIRLKLMKEREELEKYQRRENDEEIPSTVNPEMIGITERLEPVKELTDESDKRLDEDGDGDLENENPFSQFPELDNDLDVDTYNKKLKRRNLKEDEVYEQNRIKKLSRKKCQNELTQLKRKYKQIVNDIKEKAFV